jgi:hypothetical protein
MVRRAFYLVRLLLVAFPLTAFRMPSADEARDNLLYDVRGAFVTARPNVPQGLVIATDMLVDEAIRATVRSTILPRTIIAVRIDETSQVPLVVGSRHEAKVTVQAISVASGDPIAEGSFRTSIFLIHGEEADKALAEQIADKIAGEFRLKGGGRPALASALFP